MKLAQKRGRPESSLGDDEEGDDGWDSDSDDESSAKARYFGYVKQGLYYVTEMERFAPPRKRPRTVAKNYRLVSLRSTTPEELYQRKVGSPRCPRSLREAETRRDYAGAQRDAAELGVANCSSGFCYFEENPHHSSHLKTTFFRNSETLQAHLAAFALRQFVQASVMPPNEAANP